MARQHWKPLPFGWDGLCPLCGLRVVQAQDTACVNCGLRDPQQIGIPLTKEQIETWTGDLLAVRLHEATGRFRHVVWAVGGGAGAAALMHFGLAISGNTELASGAAIGSSIGLGLSGVGLPDALVRAYRWGRGALQSLASSRRRQDVVPISVEAALKTLAAARPPLLAQRGRLEGARVEIEQALKSRPSGSEGAIRLQAASAPITAALDARDAAMTRLTLAEHRVRLIRWQACMAAIPLGVGDLAEVATRQTELAALLAEVAESTIALQTLHPAYRREASALTSEWETSLQSATQVRLQLQRTEEQLLLRSSHQLAARVQPIAEHQPLPELPAVAPSAATALTSADLEIRACLDEANRLSGESEAVRFAESV